MRALLVRRRNLRATSRFLRATEFCRPTFWGRPCAAFRRWGNSVVLASSRFRVFRNLIWSCGPGRVFRAFFVCGCRNPSSHGGMQPLGSSRIRTVAARRGARPIAVRAAKALPQGFYFVAEPGNEFLRAESAARQIRNAPVGTWGYVMQGGRNYFRATGAYPKGTECARRKARGGSLSRLDQSCRLRHLHPRASFGCKTCCGSSLKAPPAGCQTTFAITGDLGSPRAFCGPCLVVFRAAHGIGKALGQ
jgi:hypothetical protein